MSDTRTPCPLKGTEGHRYLSCSHCQRDTLWRHYPDAAEAKAGGYYDQYLDAQEASDSRPMPLPVGTRVRHIGEQYWEATGAGTGTVLGIVRYYPQDRTHEYLVLCDQPVWWSASRVAERNHMVKVHVSNPDVYLAKLGQDLEDPEFLSAMQQYWTDPFNEEFTAYWDERTKRYEQAMQEEMKVIAEKPLATYLEVLKDSGRKGRSQ